MRHDPKIRRVISRYGLEGYGLYCLILECITERLTVEDHEPTMEETPADIAEFYKADRDRVVEMIEYMADQHLVELDEEVMCHKIYKYLDQASTSNPELRKMIQSYRNGGCQESSG
jgi:hypothetical protein